MLPDLNNGNVRLEASSKNDTYKDVNQDTVDLELSIQHYRNMSTEYHPYVIVPAELSAAALLEKRPLLVLAITVVTSWKVPSEQAVHRERFLKELSTRYFLNDERSLDLLQALIVYFGW